MRRVHCLVGAIVTLLAGVGCAQSVGVQEAQRFHRRCGGNVATDNGGRGRRAEVRSSHNLVDEGRAHVDGGDGR